MTGETDDLDEIDEDVDVFEQPVSDQASEPEQDWAALPSSAMLSLDDADELFRWRAASVVAVVGERNGGKTTLVSEIYERFLRGPFADTLFCDSWSLSGFEMKSFQSRAESGADIPDTPRTSAQDGLRFFHLAVSDAAKLDERTDLLISERAGETYREIRDNPEQASEMIELRKAAVIAFIVDGERVADPRKRAEVFASVRNIIRALHETGVIKTSAQVQLVTTKYDLMGGESAVEARVALSEFENRIIAAFGDKYLVRAFQTAARDPAGVIAPATGVAPLFRSWLEIPPLPPLDDVTLPELKSEFDRLITRRVKK